MAQHDNQIIIVPMSSIKRLALRFLTNPVVLRGVERTTRGAASILTLHRFAGYGRTGHDGAALARNLEWLRRRRYRVVPVMELIDQLRNRRPIEPRTVAFTVDDGYIDFAEVGAPVFAKYDCPVTVFLITGFIDGGSWLWWDRVRYALERTRQVELEVMVGNATVRYNLGDLAGRVRGSRDLITRLKNLPNEAREGLQREVEARLEVPFPSTPPVEFGPMTWDQVRRLAAAGVTFGPHTITHPILSKTSDEQCRREILGSWERLTQQTAGTVPVFCWPNGDPASFGSREIRLAAEAGMVAALSTVHASLTPSDWTNGQTGAYALPRYAYPQHQFDFAQVVSGLERLKGIARTDLSRVNARVPSRATR
jgi:peptidoglycan/xylan/chitin deacetylase (PgdA/CDA1 family)